MNGTNPEFLSGWKEIAAYLRKGVRTVQRYERDMALPVRSPAGKARGSVLAMRVELDAWVRAQPFRESFQLEQPLPHTETPAFNDLKRAIADMRKLREEMSELRKELRASVQTLRSNLGFIYGVRSEDVPYRAKQTLTLRVDALQPGDGSNFLMRSGDAKEPDFESAPSRIVAD